ncbi:hypothetical protein [Actinoplanes sp. NPDC051851]|uniref:hypothetical protein n=1 Tax=Actinoplanes sp. NPDC051851 TaxID=3154753 RepID=UPI003433AC01
MAQPGEHDELDHRALRSPPHRIQLAVIALAREDVTRYEDRYRAELARVNPRQRHPVRIDVEAARAFLDEQEKVVRRRRRRQRAGEGFSPGRQARRAVAWVRDGLRTPLTAREAVGRLAEPGAVSLARLEAAVLISNPALNRIWRAGQPEHGSVREGGHLNRLHPVPESRPEPVRRDQSTYRGVVSGPPQQPRSRSSRAAWTTSVVNRGIGRGGPAAGRSQPPTPHRHQQPPGQTPNR